METLWNFLCRKREQNYQTCLLFLLVHTLIWVLPIGAAAFLVCIRLSLPMSDVIRYTGLVAGYPGMVVGFFGALLYLLRNQ
ncbi:MAG: hypothetical protein LUE14_10735 [Clostridiales bacterium]|nr:hypothetical protein [Clostridiales bacterium]MCD8133989.1 hypothetical protein [Clostridiales bacterium]